MEDKIIDLIEGQFSHTIYKSESYMVSKFKTNDGTITVTGPSFDYVKGQIYTLTGEFVDHPKYGFQFSMLTIEKYLPSKKEEIISFLRGKTFPGIGKKAAEKIYEYFGNDTLNILKEDPSKILEIDLTNKQFSFLTVIERDYSVPKEKGVYWKCKCVCGNFTSVRTSALKDGSTKSCGCKRKELTRERQMIDITNKKFGHLLAIEPVFDYAKQKGIKNSGNIIYWKCKCDCGNICIEPGTELRSGEITNCADCASVSKGEEKIKLLLDNEKITYIYNNNYFKDLKNPQNNNCLRYDFIVIDKNRMPLYLIEYDGEQHFKSIERWGGEERLKKQQSYDNIKNAYAINHNLPLIRIPYTHYKDLCLQDLLPETSKYLITTDSGYAAERITE